MHHQIDKNTKFTDSLERQLFQYTSERPAHFTTPLLSDLVAFLKNAFSSDLKRKYTYPNR
jgi:hypothetical protein